MNNKTILSLAAAASLGLPTLAVASPNISGGVWASYRYVTDSDFTARAFNDEVDEETGGDIGREALILYVDGGDGPWTYSAETRFGPGSFTDPADNSTGDNFAIHKAWLGYAINDAWDVKIGKSQVPFGWKTVNFWPGDLLQGGYGDQMDVGAKVTGAFGDFGLSVAYYHQDDWGETSTDTVDDNNHWGNAQLSDSNEDGTVDLDDVTGFNNAYRKIQTGVIDLNYTLSYGEDSSSQFGVSAQAGELQDLSSNCVPDCDGLDDGSHNAVAVYYQGQFGPLSAKAEVIQVNRDVPNVAEDIENTRYAGELGYSFGNWFAYLDATAAETSTDGNDADMVQAFAPGVSYDYGPGWFYAEYLQSDGDINDNGDVYEADFNALYLTMDYYF